jgi:hypothetical protein
MLTSIKKSKEISSKIVDVEKYINYSMPCWNLLVTMGVGSLHTLEICKIRISKDQKNFPFWLGKSTTGFVTNQSTHHIPLSYYDSSTYITPLFMYLM